MALLSRTRQELHITKFQRGEGPKGIDVHLNLFRPIRIKRFVRTNQSEQNSRGGLFEA